MAETVGDIYVDLTFSARKTDFTGRIEETRQLKEFLCADAQLLWWQVAGPGGEGKSRIALDLVDGLDDNWYGGFLSSDQLARTDWSKVRFHEPTLIVIDYLAAPQKAAAFVDMVVALRNRERGGKASGVEPLGNQVRILVLERESYYLGEAQSDRAARNWLSEQISDLNKRGVLLATAFNQSVGTALSLAPMSAEDLLLVANSWRAHRQRDPLTQDEAAQLVKALGPEPAESRRSRAWRPLFAMMHAEMVGRSGSLPANKNLPSMGNLLGAALRSSTAVGRMRAVSQGVGHAFSMR